MASKDDPDEPATLRLTRHYDAPPEKVWEAWTDPESMKLWWRPNESDVVHTAEADVRVGGRFHVVFSSPGTTEVINDVSGVYREVVPLRRLVFSWAWKRSPERESQVTVTFEPSGTGTDLTLLHERLFDADDRESHEDGWRSALAKIDAVLG